MKRFLPLALLLSSCASPYSISQLNPVAQNSTWLWGREYVEKTTRDVTVKLAFENNDRRFNVFNIIIENNSDTAVLIDPAKFQVALMGNLLPKNVARKQAAWDPEVFFLDYEKQKSKLYAEEINTSIRQTTEVITETANNVASLKRTETDAEIAQRQLDQDEAKYRRQMQDYELQMKRYSLNQQKFYFDQQLLRKTTLLPHSFIYGKVFFPRHNQAAAYEIAVPVNDTTLTFQYSQKLIQP